ncbi:MAG: Na-K-Cl cotransporter, partial [Myxococcota bacterium]
MEQQPVEAAGQGSEGRFGTFAGVFTPSILTILGVVMYLLVGRVTGEAGLGRMLLIVVIAHLISFATGLSVASIATNRTVGAGGAYYMISRSLGAPAGAAIGIPLFFAQGLSVTFYIVGFTDALMPLIPEDWRGIFDPVFISTGVNILLTMLSMKSADLALKVQYVVMGAIVLSLISFFTGTAPDFPQEIVWFNEDGESFNALFAIFFPAVTGIMAGVSMSGDLKDARRSLPLGTLCAIGVGMLVYIAFPVWLSLNFDNDRLATDPNVVWSLARWPELIYLGVWGATLSSALGSILTAPRTLQALAMDGLAPRLLSRGSGPNNEPRIGMALTFCLAQAGIFLGSLDAIAPVLTMFFLATYGFTNLACGLQKWADSPSYRPSFRTPAVVSLAGAAACFYVMSIINLPAMFAATLFCALIFVVASRRDLGTTWGDSRHGIWSALVRYALQRLRRAEYHPQNWRPNLVIAGGDPNKRPHLLHLGSAIVQNRGIVTYFHLLRGAVEELAEERKRLFGAFEERMTALFPHVFYRVDIVDDVYEGAVQVAQSYGMGNFESNCVLAGWPRKRDRLDAYFQMCRNLSHLDRSVLLVNYDEDRKLGQARSIQVWWG